jgi:hypothetical protein
VKSGHCGDARPSETREPGATLTNGIRLRQATRLSSPNVLPRDRLYATYGTHGTEAANAARPITNHLSPITSHDIGVASTCGLLCCSWEIFPAAAVTSASVKSALITTVA